LVQDQALPKYVVGDDGRLRQILLNVVGNAVKFTAKGGVTIKTNIEQDARGHRLKISVIDTGVGIPVDRIKTIFDKFQQADSKITRKFGGTGLGLSISKKLAKLMGGDITVTSNENEGATFDISLKFGITEQQRVSFGRKDVVEKNIAPMSILIAEDNKTNRFLISKYLQDLPLELNFAHDGLEAVERAHEFQPDLIFMDMSMPNMDGIEATERIRASPDRQPHIIALTANAFASDREACFAAGMNDFLAKPVKKIDLLQKLQDVSDGLQANPL